MGLSNNYLIMIYQNKDKVNESYDRNVEMANFFSKDNKKGKIQMKA